MRGKPVAIAFVVAGLLVAGGVGAGPAPLLAPESARAGHGTACGIVTKGRRDFKVYKRKMKCRAARRGTRRWLRTREPLRGFTCQGNVPPYRFMCVKGNKVYRAIKL